MTSPMFTVQVPASTANIGPGFDSIGLAVDKYLFVRVCKDTSWRCEAKSTLLKDTPTDESNLLFQTAIQVATKYNKILPFCKLEVSSDIPLARGLGSSASAIVAGIEIANELCNLQLSLQDKLDIACSVEGHMDNVGASLFGGLVVGMYDGDHAMLVNKALNQVELVAIIPSYELKTSDSRSVLPASLSYGEAIQGSGISNLLVAALWKEDWSVAGQTMKKDLFHEPYRMALVPELQCLKDMQDVPFMYGYTLSGAGPTVLCYVHKGKGKEVVDEMQSLFPDCKVDLLHVMNEGSKVLHYSTEHIESI